MSRINTLKPRSGKILNVLVATRISGCQNQKEISLEDQADHAKQDIKELYDGPCEFDIISAVAKGERLDRDELEVVAEKIRTDQYDVLFMEDVGRLVRGTAAVEIWGMAVDRNMRCIAPNDGCDSVEPTWEEDLIAACKDHVSHCAHTSRRIKQKQMTRFKRNGGAIPLPVYGYNKPEGAKFYSELKKDETATPYLKQGLKILKRTRNWTAVADYFNTNSVPTGPYCRKDKWDGVMIKRLYHNPILKGKPQRGARYSVKQNSTGRRITKVNPDGPNYREEPHLAHFEPHELDPVLQEVDETHKKLGRRISSGIRTPGSRKRSRFPGQCATCYYCGRQMVWSGNGLRDNLMCNGARKYKCWNSFSFNGPCATEKIVNVITSELAALDGFQKQFLELIKMINSNLNDDQDVQRRLRSDELRLQQERERLKASIRELGERDLLKEMLDELEEQEVELERRQIRFLHHSQNRPQLPDSVEELRERFHMSFHELAVSSFECGDLLRQLVPEIHIYMVQLIDGGNIVPRARVKLSLGGMITGITTLPEINNFLSRELTLDLFEPPTRERIREEVVRRTNQGQHQHQIATELNTHQATVQRALKLDKLMQDHSLSSPYIFVTSPPAEDENRKVKRSRNGRYQFEPLSEYVPPHI
ncbi:hypothetical protein [Gimesia sp.]|uniref:hypothetical protein n=1 Tax=Gimesia sp. TaxID=2024833 RepID=UPI003A8DCB2C